MTWLNLLLPFNCLQHRHAVAKTFKHPAYVKHSRGISHENLMQLICFPKISKRPSQNKLSRIRTQNVNPNKTKNSFFLYTSSEVFSTQQDNDRGRRNKSKIQDSDISNGNLAKLNNQNQKKVKLNCNGISFTKPCVIAGCTDTCLYMECEAICPHWFKVEQFEPLESTLITLVLYDPQNRHLWYSQ